MPGGGKVLEIGVGTGCGSLVLAELGYAVDGIDLEGVHSEIAKCRLALRGCRFNNMWIGNAAEVVDKINIEEYSAVFIWATLEHMTYAERIKTLSSIWNRLRPNSRLFVIECPNRLWYFDSHTSQQPFFHWLPDELLPRLGFFQDGNMESVCRSGRGSSYHEFQLAGIPVSREDRAESVQLYARARSFVKRTKWIINSDGRYERLLFRLAARVHRAFFHEYLDLWLQKR